MPEPGAAPGFSVEQPANRSVQNVQTACHRDPQSAKLLGLTVPQSLLATADEVIE